MHDLFGHGRLSPDYPTGRCSRTIPAGRVVQLFDNEIAYFLTALRDDAGCIG